MLTKIIQQLNQTNPQTPEKIPELYPILDQLLHILIKQNIPTPWKEITALLSLKDNSINDLIAYLISINSPQHQSTLEIIEEVIANAKEKSNEIYLTKEIPDKKYHNASQSMNITQDIILLYDSTVFGSAKEGICITNDTLYFKNIAENQAQQIKLNELKSVSLSPSQSFFDLTKLIVNNIPIDGSANEHTNQQLIEIINKIIERQPPII